MNKKLALIGSGIKSISHLTIEAQAYIKQAECVLYLVNEPILEEWLNKYSKKCVSLESTYFSYNKRADAYKNVSNQIINYFDFYSFISVVIYGHPTIFSTPGLDAIKEARKRNIETLILPGISAEDCLFAELEIDPSKNGCISVEATNFLLFNDPVYKHYDLVIWQLGMLGNFGHLSNVSNNGIHLIKNKLLKSYSNTHEMILFEGSLYPGVRSKVIKFPLEALDEQNINTITTLFIPGEQRVFDKTNFSRLVMKIS